MKPQAIPPGEGGSVFEILKRQHLAGLGILQAQQTGPGEMKIIRLDDTLDILQREFTCLIEGNGLGLNPAQNGAAARIPGIVAKSGRWIDSGLDCPPRGGNLGAT